MQVSRTTASSPVNWVAGSVATTTVTPARQPSPTENTSIPITPSPALQAPSQPKELSKEATADMSRKHHTRAPAMPNLTTSDRAAIASATGYYLSPDGEITPDGTPPWSFIIQYTEQRHQQADAAIAAHAKEAVTATADTPAPTTDEGQHVDVLV
jgi:hypothetical protein